MSGYLAFFPSGHQDNWMTVQFLPAVHQVPMSIQLCSQRTPIRPVPINNLALVIDALHGEETGLEWNPHLLQDAAVAHYHSSIGRTFMNGLGDGWADESHVNWMLGCIRDMGVSEETITRYMAHNVRDIGAVTSMWRATIGPLVNSEYGHLNLYQACLIRTVINLDRSFQGVSIEKFRFVNPFCQMIGVRFIDYIKMTRADIVVAVAKSTHKGTPEILEILAANLEG